MQVILNKHCDNDPMPFRTTTGDNKLVNIALESDEGTFHVTLKSRGRYRLKIGYNYSVFDNEKGKVTRTLKKFYTDEEILSLDESISVGHSWVAPEEALEELDIDKGEDEDSVDLVPFKFHILELEYLGKQKKE